MLRRPLPHAARLAVWIPIGFLAIVPALNAQSNAQLQTASRITQAINESALVTLRGTVHPLANASNDAGEAAPDLELTRLQLRLKRSPEQESALQQLIASMHTPGSTNYHHWLTPTQFGQQFGPSGRDIQTLSAWVQSHGFQVEALNPGSGTLEISGSVGQLEDTFHTSIHKYMVNGQPHYANSVDPQIPAALAPVLGGFVSLNNFPLHRMSRTLGKATYDPQTDQARPQWTIDDGGSPLGYDLVVAPQDYYTQYDLGPLYTAGTNGGGQTIAIINDSNINVAVANNFRSLFGLPFNPPLVILGGNDPGIDGIDNPDGPNYDSGEAYLDVEWSGAVAPNATIDLVIGADTALENGLILAAERAVYSDLAPVMSLSFGACETNLASGNQFPNALWEQAAAEGITVLVSTGDSGSAGCDNPDEANVTNGTLAEDGLAVSGYASTPYDVAVGGTDFYYSSYDFSSTAILNDLNSLWSIIPTATPPNQSTIKQPIPEQPWNDSYFGLDIFRVSQNTIAAGSGGPSTCGNPTTNSSTGAVITCAPYAKPSWQAGNGVPSDGARDLPDVSLFAADGLNDSFLPMCASAGDCVPGSSPVQITGVGGTSASAPAMAGIMALVNQLHGPQGQADFVLYPLATQYPAAFHDVTRGTNAVPCELNSANCITLSNGNPGFGELSGYPVTAGYDLATGLGSIDANVLVSNWGNVKFTTTTATLTPSSTSFTHGTAITINASIAGAGGTPTGNISLMTNSPEMSNQAQTTFPLSSGSASGSVNFLPGGTYSIWGQYSGDSAFASATSNKTQITVTPENSSLRYRILSPQAGGACASGYACLSSGSTVPYGSRFVLEGEAFPSNYYTSCVATGSTSTACESATYTLPTGSITFTDNGNPVNTTVVNTEGDAEFNSGGYSVGVHSIAASYSGDDSYGPSSASAITFTVVQAPASAISVNVTSNLNPIAQDQTLVLTAIVSDGGTGAAPTGTVTFDNGSAQLGMATLSAGIDPSTGATVGIATLTISNVAMSAALDRHDTSVLFWGGGGATLAGIILLGIPRRRRKWQDLLGLLILAVLTAGIGCGSGSSSAASGSSGTTANLALGSSTIIARYGGDTNYAAAASSGYQMTVNAASSLLPSITTGTASASNTSSTGTILVTATVTAKSPFPSPTGTVEFLSWGKNLGTVPLKLSPNGTTEPAALVLNSQVLPQGASLITLQYSGDTNYQPSSANLSISNPLSDFSMVAQTQTIGVSPGRSSLPDTIYFSSVNGFNSTVSLTCSAPSGLTCALSSNSVPVTQNASTTLTISAPPTTPPGSYTVEITGSQGSALVHTLAIEVAVQ